MADKDKVRIQPHNIEAEEGLLAACLLGGGKETLAECIEKKITSEFFYKDSHQIIYEALLQLFKVGDPIDEIILFNHLKKTGKDQDVGGIDAIYLIQDRIQTAIHANYFAKIIKEKYLLRSMIKTSRETIDACYEQHDEIDSFIGRIEQSFLEINQANTNDSAKHISEPLGAAIETIHNIMGDKELPGIYSGFKDLDELTYGFQPGEMIVLAARPSVGKTSLAMNIAENVVLPNGSKKPKGVLMFSLEMTSSQLASRLICSRAKVDYKRIRDRVITTKEMKKISDASNDLKKIDLWIDDASDTNIYQLRAKSRRLHSRNKDKLGLIIIDYLQLIRGVDSKVIREQQIADISRGIKSMSQELKIPVLVLSQLNRDSERENRNPRLSDLRESGSIEQDADVVMMLHRPKKKEEDSDDEIDNPDIEHISLLIAKQRNGPTGFVDFNFLKRFTRFEGYHN